MPISIKLEQLANMFVFAHQSGSFQQKEAEEEKVYERWRLLKERLSV